MKDDKQKGEEILKKRRDAHDGLAPRDDGKPLAEEIEDEEKKRLEEDLPIGLGVKRSG